MCVFFIGIGFLQKNVDEAVEKLKGRGIQVLGLVCHVSNPQQRKNLVDITVQVRSQPNLRYACTIEFADPFCLQLITRVSPTMD